jgi:hypothetical protein
MVESYTPAAQNNLTSVIEAFQIGMQNCLQQIVVQVNSYI